MPLFRNAVLGFATLFTCANAVLSETITIPGPAGPLAGDLLDPGEAAHIVIVVPGSGPIDRDGNMPAFHSKTDLYKQLSEALVAEGIATLRVDKRGFFGSKNAIADPNDVTIEAYSDDMLNWIARAKDVAPCVWLAGHSEGGLVALFAASTAPDNLCGVILMAASGRPIGELLIEQMEANPANGPILEDARALVLDLEQGKTRPLSEIPPALHGLFQPGLQRYMIDLFSHDPLVLAQKWDRHTLILQGDRDLQVTPKDAELLAQALPQARLVFLEGGTHILKQDVPNSPYATYSDPTLPLHPDLVPAIISTLADAGGAD
ncbi:alpha/beta hydrolase [Shimia sp.]|uniref:alpha/beta hydrolase n=1 Tax=Shimia sp. TaxID=1954381 RepID=UPI003B8E4AE5